MVELIAKSGMRICGLFLVLGLFVLVFAIVGAQMWGGQMRQRCYNIDAGFILDDSRVCSHGLRGNPWNPATNDAGATTGLAVCPLGSECLPLMDARFQGSNFDHVGASMSVILQIMTLKGWKEQMTRTQDAFSPLMIFFFFALLLAGPLYLVFMFQVYP